MTNPIQAVENFIAGETAKFLPPSIQAFVVTMLSAEGQILQGLVEVAAQDVLAGGLTTASFTTAGKDVIAKLVSQNITLGTQTVFTALNAAVAAVAPPVVAPAPNAAPATTEAAPATAAPTA